MFGLFKKKDDKKKQEFEEKKEKRKSVTKSFSFSKKKDSPATPLSSSPAESSSAASPTKGVELQASSAAEVSKDKKIKQLERDDPNFSLYDPKKMPSMAEVNKRFEKVLKYKGIVGNDKRKKAFMSKPIEDKWKIVLLHEKAMHEQEVL